MKKLNVTLIDNKETTELYKSHIGWEDFFLNKQFQFDRTLKNSINYSLIMKNGNAEQKKALNFLENIEIKSNNTNQQIILNVANEIYYNQDLKFEHFVDSISNFIINILNFLPSTDLSIQENMDDQIPTIKKKKRKYQPGFKNSKKIFCNLIYII